MRKTLVLLSSIALLIVFSCPVHAEPKPVLGKANVALKLGFGTFDHDFMGQENHYTFFELEGYYQMAPNVYLGGNIGTTLIGSDTFDLFVHEEVDFAPIELNVKYAYELGPRLVIDGGGGVSYNYSYIDLYEKGKQIEKTDWLLGGQVFFDLIYKFERFSIGAYGKYQVTEDVDGLDRGFTNWRGGLQLGMIF